MSEAMSDEAVCGKPFYGVICTRSPGHLGGHVHQGDHPTHGQNRIAGRDPVSRPTVTDELEVLIDCMTSFDIHGAKAQAAAEFILSDRSGLVVRCEAVAAPAPDRDDFEWDDPEDVELIDNLLVRHLPTHDPGLEGAVDHARRALQELAAGVGGVPAEPQPDGDEQCPECSGSGCYDGWTYVACPCCRGAGAVPQDREAGQ